MTYFLVPHKVSREMQKKEREDADLRKLAISYSESRVTRHKEAGRRGEGLVPSKPGDFFPTWITQVFSSLFVSFLTKILTALHCHKTKCTR